MEEIFKIRSKRRKSSKQNPKLGLCLAIRKSYCNCFLEAQKGNDVICNIAAPSHKRNGRSLIKTFELLLTFVVLNNRFADDPALEAFRFNHTVLHTEYNGLPIKSSQVSSNGAQMLQIVRILAYMRSELNFQKVGNPVLMEFRFYKRISDDSSTKLQN